MGKTFEELQEKLDGLYELKEEAEKANSEDKGNGLRQKVFDSAKELLSSTGEFSLIHTKTDIEGMREEKERWRQEIKWPAEALRDWALRIR